MEPGELLLSDLGVPIIRFATTPANSTLSTPRSKGEYSSTLNSSTLLPDSACAIKLLIGPVKLSTESSIL